MRPVILALLLAALAGCAGDILARERSACQAYGFTPGSENFAQCMMTVDQSRKNRAAVIAGWP